MASLSCRYVEKGRAVHRLRMEISIKWSLLSNRLILLLILILLYVYPQNKGQTQYVIYRVRCTLDSWSCKSLRQDYVQVAYAVQKDYRSRNAVFAMRMSVRDAVVGVNHGGRCPSRSFGCCSHARCFLKYLTILGVANKPVCLAHQNAIDDNWYR